MRDLAKDFTRDEIINFVSISDILESADEGLYHFAIELPDGDTLFSENGSKLDCMMAIQHLQLQRGVYFYA